MAVVEAKKIILKRYDVEVFEIDELVAMESQLLMNMAEDDCVYAVIWLPNIASKILEKEIEYCKKHVEEVLNPESADDDKEEEDLKNWDAEFIQVDKATLHDLILAANYMNIKGLLDLACRTVADIIKGKTPEEICKTFNIEIDFTPEEELEIHIENQWEFE